MKVLITGASGFIGKSILESSTKQGIHWVPFRGNILCRKDWLSYKDCDALLHLAGIVRSNPNRSDQQQLLDTNIHGTYNALHFAGESGIRIIYASSCRYADGTLPPHKETDPITFHDPYTFSKWISEQTLKAWHQFFQVEGVIVRIFNVYGPSQPFGFLIPDILSMVKGEQVTMRSLTAIRDFIYIDDLVDLFGRVLLSPFPGMLTINAGSGKGTSVEEVLKAIFELFDRKLPVTNRNLSEAIPKSIADVKRACDLYGWQTKTDLREGLARVMHSHGLL
jgi:nucleoside-diphosphate-sugar epimerase